VNLAGVEDSGRVLTRSFITRARVFSAVDESGYASLLDRELSLATTAYSFEVWLTMDIFVRELGRAKNSTALRPSGCYQLRTIAKTSQSSMPIAFAGLSRKVLLSAF